MNNKTLLEFTKIGDIISINTSQKSALFRLSNLQSVVLENGFIKISWPDGFIDFSINNDAGVNVEIAKQIYEKIFLLFSKEKDSFVVYGEK
jgi:hypothetical protein